MDVSEKHMNDSRYFAPIYREMANGGKEAMLYELLNYNIDNFDLRKFPRREALLDQIIQTMSSDKKFWYEQLSNGRISSISEKLSEYSTSDWPDVFNCTILYEMYLDFAKRMNNRYPHMDRQFGKQLRKLCPAIGRRKIGDDYHYFLPTLSECRAHFESLVNIKIDWDT
jgi:hypothetical protein